jgi:hypothetical protein
VLGLTETADDFLCDSRVGSKKQHQLKVGFIVSNVWKAPEDVVRFYNGRGTAEQWIKEGKNAVKWTKLSCSRFKDNQTHLQLSRWPTT